MDLLKTGLIILLLAALICACDAKDGEGNKSETDAKKAEIGIPASVALPETSEDSEAASEDEASALSAVYLGVENYGEDGVDKDHIADFMYRFDFDGVEKLLKIDDFAPDDGDSPSYPIQNVLKEGSLYELTLSDGVVTAASEIAPADAPQYDLPLRGVCGERTLANFLRTALSPVGRALYVYGGGWNWQDDGSSVQATLLGVSDDWIRFFDSNDESYSYCGSDSEPSKYFPSGGFNEYYYAGLDCSGYVGWAVYNTLETKSGNAGYVGASTSFAKRLAESGLGTWTKPSGSANLTPGDIVSIKGHVWIALGVCADGSVVIAHSTPSPSIVGAEGGGVQISAIGDGESCEAYELASSYMTSFYPEWSSRYYAVVKPSSVYFDFSADAAGVFTWSQGVLSDDDGLRQMSAADVLAFLYGE